MKSAARSLAAFFTHKRRCRASAVKRLVLLIMPSRVLTFACSKRELHCLHHLLPLRGDGSSVGDGLALHGKQT